MAKVLNGRYLRGKSSDVATRADVYKNAAARDPDEILREAFGDFANGQEQIIDAEVLSRG
jgi:hypothetical protein